MRGKGKEPERLRTAGKRSARREERRHSPPARAYASPDTIVTCSPEMLIKWLTPVRVNTCHWSTGMAR